MRGKQLAALNTNAYLNNHSIYTSPGVNDYGRAYLYGTEFEARDSPPVFGSMLGHNTVCSVCYTSNRSALITIPGQTTCPTSWTEEYDGYLMTERSEHPRSGRAPVCVEQYAEVLPGTRDAFTAVFCGGEVWWTMSSIHRRAGNSLCGVHKMTVKRYFIIMCTSYSLLNMQNYIVIVYVIPVLLTLLSLLLTGTHDHFSEFDFFR